MSITKTIGKETVGGGKKMSQTMHAYDRSTHDRSYLFRTTGSAGTLIPFMKQIMTPGSTLDINLFCEIMTHPTVGPLFGSMKVQLDVFSAPVRLYQGQLHNNKLNIGRNMSAVKLPLMTLFAEGTNTSLPNIADLDNSQINPSALLSYLGIRGVGHYVAASGLAARDVHALWLLMVFDIYKNYYANKQEEEGAMIWAAPAAVEDDIDSIEINGNDVPLGGGGSVQIALSVPGNIEYLTAIQNINNIIFLTNQGEFPAPQVITPTTVVGLIQNFVWQWGRTGDLIVTGYRLRRADEIPAATLQVTRFPLSTIDDMREAILAHSTNSDPFSVNTAATEIANNNPYSKILDWVENVSPYLASQQGLLLKTYQSDKVNNWLNTEWIDEINQITSVSTAGDVFTMDALAQAEKLWEIYNRIATAGGSYKDWLDVVYTDNYYGGIESPVYHGSLTKELVFQEVVSNSESAGENGGVQPLGTLAGRGKLSSKNKGGHMILKVQEHTCVMGLFSLTPRIDYSQGNDWDVYSLLTMDDFHKPGLDQIGFQDVMEEQIAWWSTQKTGVGEWTQLAYGKQPSWINYMTEINKVKGNFAIESNEMFMTLNRKYAPGGTGVLDMTSYIDPEKFNYIFAQTSLDAQNYWIHIGVDLSYRALMSAKQMPSM